MLTVTAEARVVVCVGRLTKGRGLVRLIDAWQPLSCQWPGSRLWLIGDGPFREELYAHLGDLDLRRSVHMPGSFDDLGDVLAAANLLVDPRGESTSPRTILQAIAMGLPVVGCNLETLRQTPALDAGTGRFASPLDAAELSQAMFEILNDPPPDAALAEVRQRVVSENGSERMINEHLQLFETLSRKCRADQPVAPLRRTGKTTDDQKYSSSQASVPPGGVVAGSDAAGADRIGAGRVRLGRAGLAGQPVCRFSRYSPAVCLECSPGSLRNPARSAELLPAAIVSGLKGSR